jgi:hypothetical protein
VWLFNFEADVASLFSSNPVNQSLNNQAVAPLPPEFSFKFWHTLYLKCE